MTLKRIKIRFNASSLSKIRSYEFLVVETCQPSYVVEYRKPGVMLLMPVKFIPRRIILHYKAMKSKIHLGVAWIFVFISWFHLSHYCYESLKLCGSTLINWHFYSSVCKKKGVLFDHQNLYKSRYFCYAIIQIKG